MWVLLSQRMWYVKSVESPSLEMSLSPALPGLWFLRSNMVIWEAAGKEDCTFHGNRKLFSFDHFVTQTLILCLA